MSLGSNITQKRKSLNLSQEYVADKLGVSRQAVSKWETNLSEPSTNNILKLAKLFDCDLKQLVAPEEYNEEQEDLKNQFQDTKKDIRMQMAAVFGRIFMLIGFVGFMRVYYTGGNDMGDLPDWYSQLWWGAQFVIGLIFTLIASKDYFNRKSGSKNIIWFDLFFALSIFLYSVWPFERSINTLITLVIGTVVLIIINIKFFIPTWRKTK